MSRASGDAEVDGTGVHDLTAAYAVDALDEPDRVSAEEHLATCEACSGELAAIREALADLAGATAVAPQPASRAAVLGRLGGVAQLPAATATSGTAQHGRAEDAPSLAARVGEPVRAAPVDELALRRARRRSRLLTGLASAAAVLLVATAGVLGWATNQMRTDRDAARAQASALSQVVSAPDARVVTATSFDADWSAARVVVSRSKEEAVMVAGGAGAPPAGHAWQMWYLAGGAPRSAGVTTKLSSAQVLAGQVDGASEIAVTLEPAGGSRTPTTTPVATFSLSA